MPEHHWVLTDVANRVWRENFSAGPSDGIVLSGAKHWSVTKSTLRGGLSDGVDVVTINNGRLQVDILPTRGMGLWRGTCEGLQIGWQSPVEQPVHPKFVNAVDRGGLGWLTGFNEWMCRCGLDSNGAPGTDVVLNNQGQAVKTELTLHGRVANIPAHRVEVSVAEANGGTISVTGVVDETMLFGPCLRLTSTLQTAANSKRLVLIDRITNLKGVPAELELLYHTNLGRPFLEPGARLVVPVREVAPRDARAAGDMSRFREYGPPETGFVEQAYWMDLAADAAENTQVLLRSAKADKGISLKFNKRQLPCFTVWKCTQAEADGYVTGLEPGTNYPNLKTFERQQGRVIVLQPGQTYEVRLEIGIHSNAGDVEVVSNEIDALQALVEPVYHAEPIAKYSSL